MEKKVQFDLSDIEFSNKDRIKGIMLPKETSEELAYICGVLAGDGHINIRKEKHDFLVKCVGNPEDEKEFYHQIIKPLFKRVFNIDLNVKYQDTGTTYGFYFYSKAIVSFLTKKIGLPHGKKYGKLKIPEIFLSDKELCLSFIRGVADTDFSLGLKRGSRAKPYYPVITGASRSRRFMENISNYLEHLGFKVTKYFDYKIKDERVKNGFSITNRLEINGHKNYELWMKLIGFNHTKNLIKVNKIRMANG